ncbi:MAG: hypothetical protein RIC49_12750 [Phycisphaerales bacterium]
MTSIPHWATGPVEVLRHGFSLLEQDSDTNRRLAMISIDNSVELAMQTYLSLPRRISGVDISRRQRDEYSANFPALLDGIETHASTKIIGIDLGEIEWFHRLRNELYHQGNGLTVEKTKVEAYAQLALELFQAVFEIDLAFSTTASASRLGLFLEKWIEIERIVVGDGPLRIGRLNEHISKILSSRNDFHLDDLKEFSDLRRLRNEVVHGKIPSEDAIDDQTLARMDGLIAKLKDTPY